MALTALSVLIEPGKNMVSTILAAVKHFGTKQISKWAGVSQRQVQRWYTSAAQKRGISMKALQKLVGHVSWKIKTSFEVIYNGRKQGKKPRIATVEPPPQSLKEIQSALLAGNDSRLQEELADLIADQYVLDLSQVGIDSIDVLSVQPK